MTIIEIDMTSESKIVSYSFFFVNNNNSNIYTSEVYPIHDEIHKKFFAHDKFNFSSKLSFFFSIYFILLYNIYFI